MVFVEYLAMDANLKVEGVWALKLSIKTERIGQRKVIFEVEPPTTIAIRRIDFYRRYGFWLGTILSPTNNHHIVRVMIGCLCYL